MKLYPCMLHFACRAVAVSVQPCPHAHAGGVPQGYYEDGRFGIRIENLLVCKEVATPFRFGGLASLGFDRLTLCPLQRKMLAPEVRLSDAAGACVRLWRPGVPRL